MKQTATETARRPRRKAAALAALPLAALLALGGCGAAGTTHLSFPTAATTGTIYSVGAALANLWNGQLPGLQVTAEASAGGVQNLELMARGEADITAAVTSIVTQQRDGTGAFEGRAYAGARVLAALYTNYNQVVATADSGIESLQDIAGKRFAPGASGSTTEGESRVHLEAAGLTYPGDFSAQFVGFTEAVDLMRNRQLDAAWIQAGLPTSAVSEICATAGGRLVPMDEALVAALTAEYPWYSRAIIPAGTYAGQEEDVLTTGLTIVLLADETVPEDTAYALVKAMWENLDTLRAAHSALEQMSLEAATQNLGGLPLHPGARRYYEEQGVL